MNAERLFLNHKGALGALRPFGWFSVEEERLLHRYGAWYRALHRGKIKPQTEAQRRFVSCARGEVPPLSAHEKAFCRYLEAQRREENSRRSIDNTPKQAGGIISAWNTDIAQIHRHPDGYYEEVLYPLIDDQDDSGRSKV